MRNALKPQGNAIMPAERIVCIVAGFFILLSLSLGAEASPLNNILAKFGVKGACC